MFFADSGGHSVRGVDVCQLDLGASGFQDYLFLWEPHCLDGIH